MEALFLMRYLKDALVLVFILVLLCGASSVVRAAGTAKISGQVIEAGSGLALSGVIVAGVGPTTTKATTDSKGNFTLDNLSAGTYTLIASLNGYETTETDPFPVEEGKTQIPYALSGRQDLATIV
jgi:Carboxypeptidase regulatory-like domain